MYDLYSHSRDDRCRFTLGRSGAKKLLAIGLNPSTATREKSDTTIAKVEEVARRTGHDGFVMLNLYPVRATDYTLLPRDADIASVSRNFAVIESLVAADPAPVLWAAWGNAIRHRPFFVSAAVELVMRLRPYGPCWQHYGLLTAAGHPRHPSRLSYMWRFSPFAADAYIERIGSL